MSSSSIVAKASYATLPDRGLLKLGVDMAQFSVVFPRRLFLIGWSSTCGSFVCSPGCLHRF